MKLPVIICMTFLVVCQVNGDADKCDPKTCTIEKNCRCSSTNGPLSLEKRPQLVVLAFVDAVSSDLYNSRWSTLVEPRQNPDGEYFGATFYVPHEYSDYSIVHDLATVGFEMGVHSITNDAHQSYWKNASQELLEKEFGGQKKIISKFANIDEKLITGTLTPQLFLAGDDSIRAFVSQGFVYDNSWPSDERLFPYTLDYASTQVCNTGAICPKESHPGFWISPIVNLYNEVGSPCATLASCFGNRKNQTTQEIADWLVDEVNKVKNFNRAPITLIIEETLFKNVDKSWDGLNRALDTLQKDEEIFFVSQARVIEWIKNPVPVTEFTTNNHEIDTGCYQTSCKLEKNDGNTRYMVSCVPCPKNYPWLDNPEGN